MIVFLAAITVACVNKTRSSVNIPAEDVDPTTEQSQRRAHSEGICKMHQIPMFSGQNSFFTDDDDSVTLRPKNEVIDRALVLYYVGVKSENPGRSILDGLEKKYSISEKLSPAEKSFVQNKNPTKQQIVNASYRYEDLHVLLWALGYTDTLAYPSKQCDVPTDSRIINNYSEQQFRQKARLRTKKEILDELDLVMRLHWACVDARVNNKPSPASLDSDVVYEWHYVLNWLINYSNENWDDITTDT
jgi:hypothetical protein